MFLHSSARNALLNQKKDAAVKKLKELYHELIKQKKDEIAELKQNMKRDIASIKRKYDEQSTDDIRCE